MSLDDFVAHFRALEARYRQLPREELLTLYAESKARLDKLMDDFNPIAPAIGIEVDAMHQWRTLLP